MTETEKPTAEEASFRAFLVGDWLVEPDQGRLSREGETVRIEPKAMEVLVYLARRRGEVVARNELERDVWRGALVGYDAVTSTIIKLRKALADDARHPRYIATIPKRGYQLLASVEYPPNEPRGVALPADTGQRRPQKPVRRYPPTSWGLMLVALAILTGLTAAILSFTATEPTSPAVNALEEKARALSSIAVLPFENLSGDPEQEYFVDGMTDDLITGLSKNADLLIIARDSTFVYKGEPVDVRQIADRLDVDFLLRGSVQRSGQHVRINAHLVDVTTESNLWAERYDGQLADVFSIQDRITSEIIAVLSLKASTGDAEDLGSLSTASPLAYDRFLDGRQLFYRYANKAENEKARLLYEEAIGHDANYALAYAMLAWTHAFDAMNGWAEDREQSLANALDLASTALSLEEALPVAYFVRGLAYREQGEYVKALVEAEKAIEYDPNYANAHVLFATLLYYAGRPEEGLKRIQKAIQLNPHHPYNYSFHLGQAYFVLRRYEEAINAFQQGLASNPSSERLHVWLAAALAQSGAREDAEWEAEQVRVLNPEFSLARMAETFPFKDSDEIDHFLDGLRKAGL